MLPSPNVRMSDEARSGLCPNLISHETHCESDSVSNQLPGPDHVENISVQVSTIVLDYDLMWRLVLLFWNILNLMGILLLMSNCRSTLRN